MMRLHTITTIKNYRGKRVLLRLDLNAPVHHGKLDASDTWKLRQSLSTIKYLRRRRAAIIIVSHLGTPTGYDHDLSLERVIRKFSLLVGVKIGFWTDDLDACHVLSRDLRAGEVVALENIRFHHEEYDNDTAFAKQLASLADIYVNDAFGVSHRSHASLVAVTRYLPSYAGLLMKYEVDHLDGLLQGIKRPAVAIMGGNKISTKIRLIKKLLRSVDWLLMGGALANTVLAALDYQVGKSRVEEDMMSWSKNLMDNKLKLPVDARVARSLKSKARITAIGAVRSTEIIYDIGPDSVALYENVIKEAQTVIWNGPLGYFEDKRFAIGTRQLVKALARSKARVYIGGGETVKAVLQQKLEDKIHFISTGGGAMLTLLENRPFPALRPLYKR